MTNFFKEKENKNLPRFVGKAGKNRIKLSLKIFNQILFILIIILGMYYIAGTNDLTVKGFKLQELKVKHMEIEDNNNGFELQIMSLGSYNNLNKKVSELDMVAVGHVEYISGVDSIVAKK